MSSDVALQAMYDRFVGRFVLPLVVGGKGVLVSFPIGIGAAEYFENAPILDENVELELLRARQAALAEWIPSPGPRSLRPDEVRLLAALHNVLLTSHADLTEGFRGRARWDHCVDWTEAHLEKVPDCRDAERALGRHSLLHLVPRLTREDVIVRAGASSKRYRGQDPPRRALLWPKLRKLSTRQAVASLGEILSTDESRKLYTDILELSPLTCLLSMPYADPDGLHQRELTWSRSKVAVLARADLCRVVTYRHLELGFHVVGPPLAKALVQGLEQLAAGASSQDVSALAFGLQFILNLQLTHLWTSPIEDLSAPLDRNWRPEDEAYRGLFFGWFVASLSREDRAGAPSVANPDLVGREKLYLRAAASIAREQLEDAARHVDWLAPPAAGAA